MANDHPTKELSNFGGLDLASKGAMNLTSMVFSQICSRHITAKEISMLSNTLEFNTLNQLIHQGKLIGFREAKNIMHEQIEPKCKE
ncbi:hypothetical protein [Pectobacterium versatile]|uniref:hypothetical protein n=1 Tax=Pectobacterium versatile TaxID=2488639 RepID=UPI001F3E9509|nr:hypothetical protein [Pectobacterium versatile]